MSLNSSYWSIVDKTLNIKHINTAINLKQKRYLLELKVKKYFYPPNNMPILNI